MISVQQSYSRLFRPWDPSDSNENKHTTCDNTSLEILPNKVNRKITEKRENRLRKIRGHFKKTETSSHQDATISTTTVDIDEDVKIETVSVDRLPVAKKESPVNSLSLCCDRLLQSPKEVIKSERSKRTEDATPLGAPVNNLPITSITPPILPTPGAYSFHPGFMPDYIPAADIAKALGVPTTDPLLLESLAQGYAMEYEYARILQQENEAKLLNARKQRPKKYKCPHCQVGFSNNGQLKGHIRIHTGERPYKCDEKNCGKTFTRNEELTRHKRIHSGVRPYPCASCGKRFGRRDHLKKHTRTHYLQSERMMPVFVPLSAMPQVAGFPYLYGY